MARAEGGAPLRLEEYAAGAQNETIGAALVSAAHAPARVLDLCPGSHVSTDRLHACAEEGGGRDGGATEQAEESQQAGRPCLFVCAPPPPMIVERRSTEGPELCLSHARSPSSR